MEQKTWQVYNFGERTVFRLDQNESREGSGPASTIQGQGQLGLDFNVPTSAPGHIRTTEEEYAGEEEKKKKKKDHQKKKNLKKKKEEEEEEESLLLSTDHTRPQ